jgi:hypothetical protein
VLLDEVGEALRQGVTARPKTDEDQVIGPAMAFDDLVGNPNQGPSEVVGVEDAALGWHGHELLGGLSGPR